MLLDEVRNFWAKVLGVRGPQWMIIVALCDLDEGEGVPIDSLAAATQLHPKFVTTQSGLLQKKGLVHRKSAGANSGAVTLSLTEKAYKHLAELELRRRRLE